MIPYPWTPDYAALAIVAAVGLLVVVIAMRWRGKPKPDPVFRWPDRTSAHRTGPFSEIVVYGKDGRPSGAATCTDLPVSGVGCVSTWDDGVRR